MRDVIQLVFTAGTGLRLRHHEEQAHDAGKIEKFDPIVRKPVNFVEKKISKGCPMAPPVSLWFSPSSRPPALGPRRRLIAPEVERTLRGWLHEELRASPAKLVEVSEWVSHDSRAVPHTVSIIIETRATHRHLMVEKASERIVAADVRAALASQRPRAHARDAAPA